DGGTLTLATSNAELDDDFVRGHPGSARGNYAVLTVSDTGVGMSREVIARIFEPFFTTKERGHGTGLGLAAVYGIVKQLGGYIGVRSEPGRGSAFTIYLPRTDRPAERTAEHTTAPAPIGHETVLLVEDESGVRSFARTVLQRHGYRVIEAESGEVAL